MQTLRMGTCGASFFVPVVGGQTKTPAGTEAGGVKRQSFVRFSG
jgi:hypothetical protein